MPCQFPEHHDSGGIPWWVKAGAAAIIGSEAVREITEHARQIETGLEVAAAIIGFTVLVLIVGLVASRAGNRTRAFTEPRLPPARTAEPVQPVRRYQPPERQPGDVLLPAAPARETSLGGTRHPAMPASSAPRRDPVHEGENQR